MVDIELTVIDSLSACKFDAHVRSTAKHSFLKGLYCDVCNENIEQ